MGSRTARSRGPAETPRPVVALRRPRSHRRTPGSGRLRSATYSARRTRACSPRSLVDTTGTAARQAGSFPAGTRRACRPASPAAAGSPQVELRDVRAGPGPLYSVTASRTLTTGAPPEVLTARTGRGRTGTWCTTGRSRTGTAAGGRCQLPPAIADVPSPRSSPTRPPPPGIGSRRGHGCLGERCGGT